MRCHRERRTADQETGVVGSKAGRAVSRLRGWRHALHSMALPVSMLSGDEREKVIKTSFTSRFFITPAGENPNYNFNFPTSRCVADGKKTVDKSDKYNKMKRV